jgi:hypothetical protein
VIIKAESIYKRKQNDEKPGLGEERPSGLIKREGVRLKRLK